MSGVSYNVIFKQPFEDTNGTVRVGSIIFPCNMKHYLYLWTNKCRWPKRKNWTEIRVKHELYEDTLQLHTRWLASKLRFTQDRHPADWPILYQDFKNRHHIVLEQKCYKQRICFDYFAGEVSSNNWVAQALNLNNGHTKMPGWKGMQ